MLYISGETLLMAPTAVATATTVEIHPPGIHAQQPPQALTARATV